MTTLTIRLPGETYEHLRILASQRGQAVESLAEEWLVEHSKTLRDDLPPPAPPGERERAVAVLRAAGLLAELTPEEKARAARSTLTLEEAQEILNRAGGPPLSEVVLAMRGPKT